MAKKNKEIIREYEICRCLITNIQSITGHKTHDIIAFMDGVAQQCLKDNGIDADVFPKKDKYGDYRQDYLTVKDYAYYPNTKVYLGVSITRDMNRGYNYEQDTMTLRYKFYTPSTTKKLTQSEYDEIVIDAMLTDTSLDFDPPNIKKGKTLLEKQQEEKEREEKEKQQQIARNLKYLKELLKEGLRIKKMEPPKDSTKMRKIYEKQINQNAYEIRCIINCLKNMGDKTHEVLFTPTDSNII